jgi:hypothetical protein
VEALDGALDWIGTHRRIWDERFDKLDALLADIKAAPTKSTGKERTDEQKERRHARGHDDG